MYYNPYTESEECKLLLASIKEDDPYKESKKRQIMRWYDSHWLLTRHWRERRCLFLQKVFSYESCWEPINTKEQVKLNRYILSKKLLELKSEDGEKNFLTSYERYRISCWCCFEEDIKNIFEEIKLTRGNISVESMVSTLNEGALMVFWSHMMSNQQQALKLNNQHIYVYGFRCAMVERIVEGLEFFWEKLQSVYTISFDQKENLLMEVALFKTIHHSASAEMIEFAMNHLNQDKYPELLKRDLDKNRGYATIDELEKEYFFENAKKLLQLVNSENFSFATYLATINSIFDVIKASSDNKLISDCQDYLTFIWHYQGFESHKQSLLHKFTQTLCRSRNLIFDLISLNKGSTILSKIINALSPEQMKSIKEKTEFIYEEFIKVRHTSGDNSIVRRLSDLSLDREYLQQEMTAFRGGDSVSEIEENNPTPTVERNSPDLFNQGTFDKA